MKSRIGRREFTWQASSGVFGLMAGGTLLGAELALGEEHDPAEKWLVLLGLNALARAHTMNYFIEQLGFCNRPERLLSFQGPLKGYRLAKRA